MGMFQNMLREMEEENVCNHLYSRGINEPRPRLCIHCKEPETCLACESDSKNAIHMCGRNQKQLEVNKAAIEYALEAIKVCDEKIEVEGPEGSQQWQDLKVAWQGHLKQVNKL
jgi:hypothetical protein|tara:strand:- start:26037 stop:26375 length:339 start_codon:yes stop_codon:yes gene_type:complete